MSKLTVTLPDDLHQQIRLELERQGITTAQFIELAVHNFFEQQKEGVHIRLWKGEDFMLADLFSLSLSKCTAQTRFQNHFF